MNRPYVSLVLLVLLGFATAGCDLATKHWASQTLSIAPTHARTACLRDETTQRFVPSRRNTAPIVVVPGMLDLEYAENCAGAFGMLYGQSTPWRRWLLTVGSVIAAIALLSFARSRPGNAWFTQAGVALILGGAFGNLANRVAHGFVVDFIHAHWHAFDWPVFNVADIAIAIGVALLLVPARPAPTNVARA